jgi:phosphohistidine phosphatase
MKTIFLVRHAKAVKRDKGIPDFERQLVEKGRKRSIDMANRLIHEGIKPSLFISSPASRAIETAHVFAEVLDYDIQKILIKDVLYDGYTPGAFLDMVQKIDEQYDSIMIFGHNPTLTDFASLLAEDFNQNMPKTAVAGIKYDIDTWRNVIPGEGRLIFYDYPKNIFRRDKKHYDTDRPGMSEKESRTQNQ